MRVLLTDPPLAAQADTDLTAYPNLGFLSLIGAARKFAPEAEVGYQQVPYHLEDWLKAVRAAEPDAVGLSFATMMAPEAYEAARELRKHFPDIWLICGGPHPTIAPEEVLRSSDFDICCVGEGEITFGEMLRAMAAHPRGSAELMARLKEIQGIAYKSGPDEVVVTPQRPYVPNLDDLPMMAWDLVDFTRYEGSNYQKGHPSTCVLASRGCPYACVFCSNPVWRREKPMVRSRSPESIAAEVEVLHARGVREIYIRSDEINFDLLWAKKLTRILADQGHRDLFYQLNLRADKVDDELAAGLAEMNCWMVHVGIESANQRVLDGIGKHITVEQIVAACETLRRHKIAVFAFLMLYQVWEEQGKLCYETPEEVDHTLDFSRTMFKRRLFQYMSWQFATPLPGAELWDIVHRHNLVDRPSSGSVWEVSVTLPGVSTERMLRQRRRGMMLQSWWAFRNGSFNVRMWKRIINKVRYILKPVKS